MNETPPSVPAVDDGVDRGLQALVRMLRLLFTGLRVLIVVMVVGVLVSGVFYVKEHQEAMLFRFGKLVPKRVRVGDQIETRHVLTSGRWYWAFPYPVDSVKVLEAQRSVTVTTNQFWPWVNPSQITASGAPPPPPDTGVLRPGHDGYLLTGDANIMHMVWTLTYRVTDARRYHLRFYEDPAEATAAATHHAPRPRGAMAVIESLLDQAVLAEVATWPVEDVLVLARRDAESPDAPRESLSSAVRKRVEARLDEIGLGVDVQQVSLAEVQPPQATVAAFRQVVDAAHEYRKDLDDARTYEKRVVTEAEGVASQILAEAQQYREQTVWSVEADRKYFEHVLAAYRENPRTMLVALYTDALREVLGRVETKYVLHGRAAGTQEVRLMLGPEPVTAPTAEAGKGSEVR